MNWLEFTLFIPYPTLATLHAWVLIYAIIGWMYFTLWAVWEVVQGKEFEPESPWYLIAAVYLMFMALWPYIAIQVYRGRI